MFRDAILSGDKLTMLHRHVIPIAIMLGRYACIAYIAYITHATQGLYTYGFLDPQMHNPGVLAGILISKGALVISMFFLSWCLFWPRPWITEVHMGLPGKFSARDTARVGTSSTGSSGGFLEKDGAQQERIEMVDKDDVQTRVVMV